MCKRRPAANKSDTLWCPEHTRCLLFTAAETGTALDMCTSLTKHALLLILTSSKRRALINKTSPLLLLCPNLHVWGCMQNKGANAEATCTQDGRKGSHTFHNTQYMPLGRVCRLACSFLSNQIPYFATNSIWNSNECAKSGQVFINLRPKQNHHARQLVECNSLPLLVKSN
jgi:hypothetical protein